MINADFHTHSSFSTDSEASQESMIEQAIAVGLKTYCFTDHMDYVFPEDEGFNAFLFDPGEYFAKLTELRKNTAGRLIYGSALSWDFGTSRTSGTKCKSSAGI